MKFTPLCVLVPAMVGMSSLTSCSTKADAELTHSLQEQTEKLKRESDLLAAQATAVQLKIKGAGSEDMTGPGAVLALENKEKEVIAEGRRLEKLVEDLKAANAQLAKEQSAFAQKYLKP